MLFAILATNETIQMTASILATLFIFWGSVVVKVPGRDRGRVVVHPTSTSSCRWSRTLPTEPAHGGPHGMHLPSSSRSVVSLPFGSKLCSEQSCGMVR